MAYIYIMIYIRRQEIKLNFNYSRMEILVTAAIFSGYNKQKQATDKNIMNGNSYAPVL